MYVFIYIHIYIHNMKKTYYNTMFVVFEDFILYFAVVTFVSVQ